MTNEEYNHFKNIAEDKITLGKIAQFIFSSLPGVFSSYGIESKIQKDYISENKDLSNYNINDCEYELGKILGKFKNKLKNKYYIELEDFNFIWEFPSVLICIIRGADNNENLVFDFYSKLIKQSFHKWNKFFEDTYESIKKEYNIKKIIEDYPDYKVPDISSEASGWNIIDNFLSKLIQINEECKTQSYKIKVPEIAKDFIGHFLFINFKNATEKFCGKEVCFINRDLNQTLFYFKNFLEIKINRRMYICANEYFYEMPLTMPSFFNLPLCNCLYASIKNYPDENHINKYCNNNFINSLNNSEDKFLALWFSGRVKILSLKLDESKEDKENIKQAANLYWEAFNKYKYYGTLNLKEFLCDALAVEIMANEKPCKDIIENIDSDKESSITKRAKEYWNFGYALNIFNKSVKKTYTEAYYKNINFWVYFAPSAFKENKKAKDYSYNSFLDDINLLQDISDKNYKIAELLDINSNKNRKKIGKRLYGNLNIAIMQAKTETDYENIYNFIKEAPINKLTVLDESGTTPIIRALLEYKYFVYGIGKAFRKEIIPFIKNEILRFCGSEEDLFEVSKEPVESIFYEEKDNLKKYVIIPLIKRLGKECNKHLLKSSLKTDILINVSPLQLAIDCYDLELVKLIVDNIPDNTELSEVYISSKEITPLQYAIKLYGTFCKHIMKDSDTNYIEDYNKSERNFGILPNDKCYYQDFFDYLEKIDEYSIFYTIPVNRIKENNTNIKFKEQKNLINIINYLSDKVSTIKADNFYYLIEQADPIDSDSYSDVLEIADNLIKTGKADKELSKLKFIDNISVPPDGILMRCVSILGLICRYHKRVPPDGILMRCVSNKNFLMLKLFLSQYGVKFSKTINDLIYGWNDEDGCFFETVLHRYIINKIASIETYVEMKGKKEKAIYRKQVLENIKYFFPLFIKAGAKMDIKDSRGYTVRELLYCIQDYIPEDIISKDLYM